MSKSEDEEEVEKEHPDEEHPDEEHPDALRAGMFQDDKDAGQERKGY